MLSRTGQNQCPIIFTPFYQIPSIKGIVRRVYAVNGTRRERTLKSLTIIYYYGMNHYGRETLNIHLSEGVFQWRCGILRVYV